MDDATAISPYAVCHTHPTLSLYFAEADSVTHVALVRWVISFTGSQAMRCLRAHAIA
jgi:hypothetical protein